MGAWAQGRGLQPNISFTGGEVTEWPQLAELLSQARARDQLTRIRTNGHAAHDLWNRVIEHCNSVEMVYHPEHAQPSVFMLNLTRALAQGVEVNCVFNMLPARFDETDRLARQIQERWGVRVERRMLFEDPAINRRPVEYTPEQTVKLVRQWGDLQLNGEYTDYQTLSMEGRNSFTNWECAVGMEQCIVDAWGRVARSHCRQGGHLGSIGGSIRWPTEPLVCRHDLCRNAFDILASKQISS